MLMSILMVCCLCLFTFSKKYISRVVIKFHCLVIPCINLANHAPEFQIGHVLGVICPIDSYLKKMEKFSKTMRQTAQVSSITY